MAKKVGWSPRARRHLEDIYLLIAADDIDAAEKFVDEVMALVDGLRAYPRIGRMVPEFGRDNLRERTCGRYRIVYHLRTNDHVQIAAIFHSRQSLPEL